MMRLTIVRKPLAQKKTMAVPTQTQMAMDCLTMQTIARVSQDQLKIKDVLMKIQMVTVFWIKTMNVQKQPVQ